jgi:hypothetical protein
MPVTWCYSKIISWYFKVMRWYKCQPLIYNKNDYKLYQKVEGKNLSKIPGNIYTVLTILNCLKFTYGYMHGTSMVGKTERIILAVFGSLFMKILSI